MPESILIVTIHKNNLPLQRIKLLNLEVKYENFI